MSIPVQLWVQKEEGGGWYNKPFFTVAYSEDEKLKTRDGALSILKEMMAMPIPEWFKEKSRWRDDFFAIKFVGFVFKKEDVV